MVNEKVLALELFHVLHTNQLQFDSQHNSWIAAVPNSDKFAKIEFDNIVLYSSMFLSGITKQRSNTLQAKSLLKQIEHWSCQSQDRATKVFNPDLNAIRFIPSALQQVNFPA